MKIEITNNNITMRPENQAERFQLTGLVQVMKGFRLKYLVNLEWDANYLTVPTVKRIQLPLNIEDIDHKTIGQD